MKVTREKATQLWQLFDKILKENQLKNVKFQYMSIKNKKMLEPEVKSLEEAAKPLEDYVAFERERMQLCEELAEKDDAGKPKIELNKYVLSDENALILDQKIRSLIDNKYKDALMEQQVREQQFQTLLQEEVDLDLIKINLSSIPEIFSGSELELIYDLIEE
jgi:hypothetical protein